MKYKTILVKGLEVHLHNDWENKKDLVGRGLLLDKVNEGLPFILSDIDENGRPIPIGKQVIYTYERWRVKTILITDYKDKYQEGKIYNFDFRKFYAKGISPSESNNEEVDNHIVINDSFIKVEGREIY